MKAALKTIAALAFYLLSGGAVWANDDTAGIAARVTEDWARANIASEAGVLRDLYAPEALFYGSSPDLKAGQDAIEGYFAALPKGSVKEIVFLDPVSARISDDVIVVGSLVDFHVIASGEDRVLAYRIMLTLVKGGSGAWTIAAHHAAPRL